MVPIDYDVVPRRPYAGPREGTGPRIVFFGIPSDYGTAFFLHLIERQANIVAAVCSTRWQRTHPKADLIARIAGHLGRPVEVTSNANADAFVRCLQGYQPDVVVMASFDQILKPGADRGSEPRLAQHPPIAPAPAPRAGADLLDHRAGRPRGRHQCALHGSPDRCRADPGPAACSRPPG